MGSSAAPPEELVSRLRAAGCVFAEEEAALLLTAARSPAELDAMVGQRTSGQPLEHVVGWAAFCGVRIAVERGVFVPRRRTEALVRQALPRVRAGAVVVDLCCGSGAIGAVLAARVPGIELYAADKDEAAVRCARSNLAGVGQVLRGDLYDPLPAGLRSRVKLLAANVPYVPSQEVPLLPVEAREHEPAGALDGGPDGLDVLRRVASGALGWLAPGGALLAECTERQAPAATAALASAGLVATAVDDEEFETTVVVGTRPRELR